MHTRYGIVTLTATILLSVGCVDIRGYQGRWEGSIINESAVREGFTENTTATLSLGQVTLNTISGVISTDDARFHETPLVPVKKASNDILADLALSGSPLRTFLLFAPLGPSSTTTSNNDNALIFLSIFSDDQVELRILKDNVLFGIFPLKRKEL